MADADLAFVANLYASTRAEEVAATGWPPSAQQAFLAQQHEAQHRHYRSLHPAADWLIVERAGTPIGRLYLDDSGEELRLIDISLLPEERGAGLGRALIADLMTYAQASAKPLSLHVARTNEGARRLYARLGFRRVAAEGESHDLLEWSR
jgi:ribosomal protein S18 acetylase RimI-like enzyme